MPDIQKINTYIHYYLLAILSTILIWGGFEYITICNGESCKIATTRLWCGLVVISAIFIPITLVLFPYIIQSIKQSPNEIRNFFKELENPQIAPFGLILKLAIAFLCVCLFVLFLYYAGLNSFAIKENSVAATQANMFVVAATLFAPLAALVFVQDWKTQHNKTTLSKEAKEIWHSLVNLNIETDEIDKIYMRSGQIQHLVYFKSVPDLYNATVKLLEKYEERWLSLHYFLELSEDNNEIYINFYGAIKSYRQFINKIEERDTVGSIEPIESELRDELISQNESVRKYLIQYILLK
ncbi:hypothetical protein E0H80_16200 [Acinetobacter sp. ANC 4779]|uniref:hypothetical protein n=1 Tax=Acinetobacter sp. ANC 4779 TaxID=2529848 RepID=UPI00103D6AC9|nr:hypothetical protein [Acinetobacter sp. ANC 4779]TCB47338.1 hypothetical protein E0H80_16200 [Acinetobacter sp. ANC 4779]